MPIRAYCTICSDFFDHCRDVAAIQCGHTFHYECLLQWFQTAPTKTCPQCRRQVSTRHIINKLFFDIGGEEEGSADPESLQNEIDRMRALLSSKERDWQDKQKVIDGLKNTVDKQRRDLDSVRKEIIDKEMLCTALKKQMAYLEMQQIDVQAAKDEVRKLRTKIQTFESLDMLLQGDRDEVESMVTDMGVSQASVEQLSIYCISLKKEYDNLKVNLKSSNDMCEKLKREVLSSNTKLQKAAMEVNQTKEDKKSLQKDLSNADKEISSLKKKVEFLQKTLSTPTRTNEALSRLVFESPAPLELKPPRLHHSTDVEEVDLNATYDITTPDHVTSRPAPVPHKKICLDPLMTSISKLGGTGSSVSKAQGEEPLSIPVFRNSLLFRKKTLGSMLDPQRKAGAVRTGYDGLGGRTKFIQPSPLAEIRPLVRTKRKKVTRRPNTISSSLTLDGFFQ
uniref:TRAF-interacting protein n=1 Tax=Iconisemion striatum TaxID=60296 RepID=A0A1A7XES4_9TELE